MERPDDLLDEPLYIDGVLVRRWDDLARLPRPAAHADGRASRWVPRPRSAEPIDDWSHTDGR